MSSADSGFSCSFHLIKYTVQTVCQEGWKDFIMINDFCSHLLQLCDSLLRLRKFCCSCCVGFCGKEGCAFVFSKSIGSQLHFYRFEPAAGFPD